MSNLTRELADWAASLQFKQLPPNVVQAAKRMLLDASGCALAGVRKPECATVLQYIRDLGGKPSCSLIGTSERTTSPLAAFYNSLAIRALDFNDVYWHCDPCHPSDIIPAALSICEERTLSGKTLLVGIVLAYEIQMRLCESAYPGIRERGWHHATFSAVTSAMVAARMMGLPAEGIASAAGIAASHSATFGVVTTGELTAMKNAADPMAVEAGVRAAMLAERGFRGPDDVLGGKEGIMHSLGKGWQPERIVADLGKKYRILQCTLKAYPVEALIQSPVTAMLQLVADRKIDPDDVREIFVDTIPRAVDLLADPAKYAPATPESADHSLPYCLAVALIDGRVTLDQFSPERLKDPQIERLMKTVRVVGDARLEQRFPITQPCRVGVATAKGESFSTKVDVPRGHPLDPMTDEEVQAKFETLAGSVLKAYECDLLRQAILIIERVDDASDFAQMLAQVNGADGNFAASIRTALAASKEAASKPVRSPRRASARPRQVTPPPRRTRAAEAAKTPAAVVTADPPKPRASGKKSPESAVSKTKDRASKRPAANTKTRKAKPQSASKKKAESKTRPKAAPKRRKKKTSKAATKKTTSRKNAGKKTVGKKRAGKKAVGNRTAAKKAVGKKKAKKKAAAPSSKKAQRKKATKARKASSRKRTSSRTKAAKRRKS